MLLKNIKTVSQAVIGSFRVEAARKRIRTQHAAAEKKMMLEILVEDGAKGNICLFPLWRTRQENSVGKEECWAEGR